MKAWLSCENNNGVIGTVMNSTGLIIKSRTVATQLRKTNPGAAQKLIRLVDRWEALRSAQRKLRNANDRESHVLLDVPMPAGKRMEASHTISGKAIVTQTGPQTYQVRMIS